MCWQNRVRKTLQAVRKSIPWVALVLLFLAIQAVVLFPFVLPLLPAFDYELDLGSKLDEFQRRQLGDTQVRLRWQFVSSDKHDIAVRGSGTVLGHPVSLQVDADYSLWRLSAAGTATCGFDNSPWRVEGDFSGSVSDGWRASAKLPPSAFDEKDPILRTLLSAVPMKKISDLEFSGQVKLAAHAFTTNGLPVPTWTATTELSDFSLKCINDTTPVSVEKLRMRIGADGIGSRVDIRPMMPKAESIACGNLSLSNVYAAMRVNERTILVTEAGAQALGGNLRLYSLVVNPKNLDAKVTLFLDNIDSEAVLHGLCGFRGTASGRLHGKLPLRLRRGERISLDTGYLYSVPGETGEIRTQDPEQLDVYLSSAGVTDEARSNLVKAMKNLSYSALTVKLKSEKDNSCALTFKMQGSATSGQVTVPVTFELNLHGDIETLINTGLQATRKGKKP